MLEQLLAALKDGGPFGLAAICMAVAAFLYHSKEQLRDEHAKALETLNKEHAAEVARLNDKRIEDMRAVINAVGTFDSGRAAIVDSLEVVSATLTTLKEKILELVVRNKGDH
jgi:hypothetical protein